MTKYKEILRLKSPGLSQEKIAAGCQVSKKTVNKVLKAAEEKNVSWPLEAEITDGEIEKLLFPDKPTNKKVSERKMPDFEQIRTELLKNGVNKKLLWTEYVDQCRLEGSEPLMYSQFCYYIQENEQLRRATMHINRKPGEQIEVDWAGDPAYISNPETGEPKKAFVFVGVLSYSRYAYAEAFEDEKQKAWIKAHVHMFEYFGGVSKILVPDNCKTAVIHNRKFDNELNKVYQELAEHYGTAIIPARVRTPRDKPSAEGSVGNISTWIIAALRNQTFFFLAELNAAIRKKLEEYNTRPFQKKDGSRKSLFVREEKQHLLPLPEKRYENAEWRIFTVQYNYHISFDGNLYSVPYSYIGKKVDAKITDAAVEIFFEGTRIATHARLYGRKGQYSTQKVHMPVNHQSYNEWDGDRFRNRASKIGPNTKSVIDSILKSKQIEQQTYKGCMGVLSFAKKFSPQKLESACTRVIELNVTPCFKNAASVLNSMPEESPEEKEESHGITRGSDYYRRLDND